MDVAVLVTDGVADFGYAAVIETFNTANAVRDELIESAAAGRSTPDTPKAQLRMAQLRMAEQRRGEQRRGEQGRGESPRSGAPMTWRVRTVSPAGTVRTGNGLIMSTTPPESALDKSDVVLVPAVNVRAAEGLIEMVSSPEHQWLRDAVVRARAAGSQVAGACTGTFFLAEAGVLDGLPATTSWWLGPAFRRRYPDVQLDVRQTVHGAENVTTAGAAMSHLDLALSVVHAADPAQAQLAARYLMLGNRNTHVDLVLPAVLSDWHPLIAKFDTWVRRHLADSFQISDVADALGVTERSLQRLTHTELRMSPREVVNELRIERASHLLRTTSLPVATIAHRVGYLNAGTLRNLIRRRRGMSIADVRASPSWYRAGGS